MQIPQKLTRLVRYAIHLFLWLFVLHVAINAAIESWSGVVFWTTFFVFLGIYVWLQVKEAGRRRCFDEHLNAEQLSVIVRLRQIVAAFEAHTPCDKRWKDILSRRRWMRTRLPDMPSMSEIGCVFKECEDAVGPFDINMHLAMSQLISASRAQSNLELERMMIERYILFIENTKGKEQENLVPMLARLGHLHFMERKFDESADQLTRALSLNERYQQEDSKARGLLSHAQVVIFKGLLAVAYTMTKNLDAAETTMCDLLPVLEEEQGVLSEGPMGAQSIRGSLISLYIQQGRKALLNSENHGSDDIVNRYLRDALALAVVHPAFYSHNLKNIGRLFIWAGRTSDGQMAFRLANRIFKAGKSSGSPQRNCLCDTHGGLHEVHGFRQCDACNTKLALNDRWFFCTTCADVDLCAECYPGIGKSKVREWEDVGGMPKTCLAHDFFEVTEDEREEQIPVHVWIEDVSRRLRAGVGYEHEDWAGRKE
jgi:hypothetical protein